MKGKVGYNPVLRRTRKITKKRRNPKGTVSERMPQNKSQTVLARPKVLELPNASQDTYQRNMALAKKQQAIDMAAEERRKRLLS